MDKDILNKLAELKPALEEKFGIEEIAVFGSVARGDNTKMSDIDIAIIKMRRKTFENIFAAKEFLEKNLNAKVDLGLYSSIRPVIKKAIEKELIHV